MATRYVSSICYLETYVKAYFIALINYKKEFPVLHLYPIKHSIQYPNLLYLIKPKISCTTSALHFASISLDIFPFHLPLPLPDPLLTI